MSKGSKKIFDILEMDVPHPYGQISTHEKGISNKGEKKAVRGEVRGQGIVLKNKIRKAISY